MIEEMAKIGAYFYKFFEPLHEKVVVINSCDLAHTYKISHGPDMGKEPYGISPSAEPFGKFIEYWAQNPTTAEGKKALLVDAAQILR